MSTLSLTTAQLIDRIPELKAGDHILLSGAVYTARDAAHERLSELVRNEKPLPFKLKNAIIYYCGPAPAKPGNIIGPCGPTTSSRMDRFTPLLLAFGIKATIGKGPRSPEVVASCKENKAVYLVATGGVAALLSKRIKMVEPVAFGDLGPEAIVRLEFVDFPLIVAVDAQGNDIFEKNKFQKS